MDFDIGVGSAQKQVIEVAFDPTKAQRKEYVTVRVRFDVSKPIRRSKVVNIPTREVTTVLYDYEKFQKRCYTCQRLTHEQDICPIFLRKKQGLSEDEMKKLKLKLMKKEAFVKETGPLFGVLEENQVGVNDLLGQKTILRLEPASVVSLNVDKRKESFSITRK